PRSRGRRQLLRAVRRAPDLRRDPARRAGDRAAADGLDVLVLSLRRHGVGAHLPARRCRPPARVGDEAAQVAVGRGRGAGGVQPPRGARDPAGLLRIARGARKGRGEIERALRAVAAAPVTAANAGIRPGPLRIDSPRPFDTLRLDSRIRGKDRSIDFARPSTGAQAGVSWPLASASSASAALAKLTNSFTAFEWMRSRVYTTARCRTSGGTSGTCTRSPRRTSFSQVTQDMIAKPRPVATRRFSASGLLASMTICSESGPRPACSTWRSMTSRVPDPTSRLMYGCSVNARSASDVRRASGCDGAQTTRS